MISNISIAILRRQQVFDYPNISLRVSCLRDRSQARYPSMVSAARVDVTDPTTISTYFDKLDRCHGGPKNLPCRPYRDVTSLACLASSENEGARSRAAAPVRHTAS